MAKIGDILKSYRKNTKTSSVKDSPYSKINGFIDTGCYAINRVITGDIHKGIPFGRITDIYGESQSGKSWLAANIIANALKQNDFQRVMYFDSEGGGLFGYLESKGVDLDKVEHIPVKSTEDCKIKLVGLYEELANAATEYYADPDNNEMPKILCVLDSFGMLDSDKTITDADKGKATADMGAIAKAKNSMMKTVAMRVVLSNCPLVIINHIYRNPGQMFPSKILEQPGGEGIRFASHVQLQMSKLLVKASDTDYLTGKENENDSIGFFKGNRIKAFCAKNRDIKPCYEATMYIDFATGIAKYDGLIEDAITMGFVQQVRGGYIVPSYSDKKIPYKTLVSSDEVWNTFIEDFNKKSIEMMSYSSSSETAKALDEIEEEINE